MKISNDSVVSFHFTLSVDGKTVQSSFGSEPLVYLHGRHAIVPGLEEALNGHATGDKLSVTLEPERAYGHRNEDLVQKVPLAQFPREVEPGMQFQVNGPQGPMIITVTQVSDSEATVDGNPELAGQTLNFEIEVVDVRTATREELAHGHVHGPGGHHHD